MASPDPHDERDAGPLRREIPEAEPGYIEFFGFATHPFPHRANPQHLFLTEGLRALKTKLPAVLATPGSLAVITGEVGAGKTTLIREVVYKSATSSIIAWINQTLLGETEFLQMLLVQLGLEPFGLDENELVAHLTEFLVEQHNCGGKIILVVDEAHNMSPRVIEQINMLLQQKIEGELLFSVVLIGEKSLERVLQAANVAELATRVTFRTHLDAFSIAETGEYIQHQLEAAGLEGESPFPGTLMPLIHKYTGGSLHRINTLCNFALLNAFLEQVKTISTELLELTLNDLQWAPEAIGSTSAVASSAGAPAYAIKLVLDFDKGREFVVEKETVRIGRSADNEVRINDPMVSRHHASIITRDGVSYIQDEGSTNGVYINRKRIKRRLLHDGDKIWIDRNRFRFFRSENP